MANAQLFQTPKDKFLPPANARNGALAPAALTMQEAAWAGSSVQEN